MELIEVNRRELLMGGVASAAALTGNRAHAIPDEPERRLRLGIVTYNVAKDWDLPTILDHCKAAGIEGVEFRTTHAHGVEPDLDAARRAEVRQRCRDAGLRQVSLGTTCEFQAADPAVVRANIATCQRFIGLARDLGARGVKVRPNGLPKEASAERTMEQIGRALAECGRMGRDAGVEIWMEVHGGGTQIPANARKIMDLCGDPNVGVTWNSNATDVVNGSVRPSFDLLRPFIRCCHINDLWGAYPYRELFGLLKGAGYDRFTLCEVGASIRPEDGVTFLKCYRGLWNELSRPA